LIRIQGLLAVSINVVSIALLMYIAFRELRNIHKRV